MIIYYGLYEESETISYFATEQEFIEIIKKNVSEDDEVEGLRMTDLEQIVVKESYRNPETEDVELKKFKHCYKMC